MIHFSLFIVILTHYEIEKTSEWKPCVTYFHFLSRKVEDRGQVFAYLQWVLQFFLSIHLFDPYKVCLHLFFAINSNF